MYCDECGEEPVVSLEQCPKCKKCLCESCWGDKTQIYCSACIKKEEGT